MAYVIQSRPDCGLDFMTKVLKSFKVVPSSLGSSGFLALPAAVEQIWHIHDSQGQIMALV